MRKSGEDGGNGQAQWLDVKDNGVQALGPNRFYKKSDIEDLLLRYIPKPVIAKLQVQ